jgi:quercetin dioxygenase-like cupin family protein
MGSDDTVVPDHLRLQIAGLLEPGMLHNRVTRLEELYDLLPKDPTVRVGIYTSEIAPQGKTTWHLHNGAAFFLVLQGRVTIEFQDHTREYQAGDAYVVPIGVIHRARNPEPEVPFLCVGFAVTSKDRDPVVNVKEPW